MAESWRHCLAITFVIVLIQGLTDLNRKVGKRMLTEDVYSPLRWQPNVNRKAGSEPGSYNSSHPFTAGLQRWLSEGQQILVTISYNLLVLISKSKASNDKAGSVLQSSCFCQQPFLEGESIPHVTLALNI